MVDFLIEAARKRWHGTDQFVKFVNKTYTYERTSDISEPTCLFAAIKGDHIEIVKRLLRIKEIDINKVNKHGSTPLHVACWKGCLEIVKVKSFSSFS